MLTQQDISPYSSTHSRCVRINCSPRYDYDPSNVHGFKRQQSLLKRTQDARPDISVDELKSRLLDTTNFYAERQKTIAAILEKDQSVSLSETRREIDKILDVPTPRLSATVST